MRLCVAHCYEMIQSNGKAALVLGGGQIGFLLAKSLYARGVQVYLVKRTPRDLPGVRVLCGDLTDEAFRSSLPRDVEVVFHCANPARYALWDTQLAPLTNASIDIARTRAAKLVTLDNLYMYAPCNSPLSERSEQAPETRKGEMRRELAARLFQLHERGDLIVTSGRASDFIGASTPNAMLTRDDNLRALEQGKPIYVIGDPERRHAYSYVEDVVRGLVELAYSERSDGRAWHLPVSYTGSSLSFLERLADACGYPAPNVRGVGKISLALMGMFDVEMRELREMLPAWERDYLVDDSHFREVFGWKATPVGEVIADIKRSREECS